MFSSGEMPRLSEIPGWKKGWGWRMQGRAYRNCRQSLKPAQPGLYLSSKPPMKEAECLGHNEGCCRREERIGRGWSQGMQRLCVWAQVEICSMVRHGQKSQDVIIYGISGHETSKMSLPSHWTWYGRVMIGGTSEASAAEWPGLHVGSIWEGFYFGVQSLITESHWPGHPSLQVQRPLK